LVEQLRQAIRSSGESLNQLGERSGLDSARLSRFMRGERDLTLSAAEKLCDVLGLHLAGGKVAKRRQKGKPKETGEKDKEERHANEGRA
jgi:transcriptional regulator with XRE-family HTH domain